MNLKDTTVVEAPYSIFDVKIGDTRIGWFGYNGNKRSWGCHVNVFGRNWAGSADSSQEAEQLIRDMVTMWIEELFDG